MRNLSKRSIRLFSAAIAVIFVSGLGAWAYKNYTEPVAGGPGGDGYFATLSKIQIYSQVPPEEARNAVVLKPENANSWYSIYIEPVQSFERYQSQKPTGITAERKTLVLQPLGKFNAEQTAMIANLKTYCQIFFQLPTRIDKPLDLKQVEKFSRPSGYAKGQRQYDAAKILFDFLELRLPNDAAAVLGITMEDIYSDNLSFVFGLGSWKERVGVYSLIRYFPKNGEKLTAKQKAIALRRACGVLNHEAGHMFGISHCTLYKCSMNGANSLSDSDQTPLEFCPVCRKKIEWNLKIDMRKRDAELAKFYREHGLTPFLIQIAN